MDGAYAAGDVVGGLLEIPIKSGGHAGVAGQFEIIDAANQADELTLYLFRKKPTVIADNAAFAPAEADLVKLCGTVSFIADSYKEINSMAWGQVRESVWYTASDEVLYAYIVAGGTPTFTSLTLNVSFWAD